VIPDTLIRAEFPSLGRYTYLNAAGAPPMCRRAADAGQRFFAEMAAEGDLPWERWLAQMEQVRRRLAALIAGRAEDVAFTASTSHGFSLLAPMLGRPGHVVIMDDEYPSATLPFLNYGHEVTFVAAGADGIIERHAIEAALRSDTRAVVTSTVMFRTGFRQDLGGLSALLRPRGIRLLVDASQSLGAFPIDVVRDGVDALASAAYKWLMAGYSTGVLYVRPGFLEEAGAPVAGWFSQRDPDAFVHERLDLKATAGVLEVGSPQFAGIFALGGALDLHDELGAEAIEAHITALTGYLHHALDRDGFSIASPRAPHQRAGITIVRVPDAARAVAALAEAGIIVAARGGGIRVSPHVYNREADVDHLVAALVALRDVDAFSAHWEQRS
jgi:selenocysteine lyase/cysteine desulfurase